MRSRGLSESSSDTPGNRRPQSRHPEGVHATRVVDGFRSIIESQRAHLRARADPDSLERPCSRAALTPNRRRAPPPRARALRPPHAQPAQPRPRRPPHRRARRRSPCAAAIRRGQNHRLADQVRRHPRFDLPRPRRRRPIRSHRTTTRRLRAAAARRTRHRPPAFLTRATARTSHRPRPVRNRHPLAHAPDRQPRRGPEGQRRGQQQDEEQAMHLSSVPAICAPVNPQRTPSRHPDVEVPEKPKTNEDKPLTALVMPMTGP